MNRWRRTMSGRLATLSKIMQESHVVRLVDERNANQLLIIAYIQTSVRKGRRAPNDITTKSIVGCVDDLFTRNLFVSLRSHFRDDNFAQFVEQIKEISAANNERGSASLRSTTDWLAGFPESIARRDIEGDHLATLVHAVDDVSDGHRLHVDRRNGFFSNVSPKSFRSRRLIIQFDQQVLVAVAADEKIIADLDRAHDDRSIARFVGEGPIELASLWID